MQAFVEYFPWVSAKALGDSFPFHRRERRRHEMACLASPDDESLGCLTYIMC